MPLMAVSWTVTVPGLGGFTLRDSGPWTVGTDRAAATAGSGRHVTLTARPEVNLDFLPGTRAGGGPSPPGRSGHGLFTCQPFRARPGGCRLRV